MLFKLKPSDAADVLTVPAQGNAILYGAVLVRVTLNTYDVIITAVTTEGCQSRPGVSPPLCTIAGHLKQCRT